MLFLIKTIIFPICSLSEILMIIRSSLPFKQLINLVNLPVKHLQLESVISSFKISKISFLLDFVSIIVMIISKSYLNVIFKME